MATPDTRSSLVIVKSFTYRGGLKLFSNRYHVTGPETATLAEFETIADLVVADEAVIYSAGTHIVEAIWNDASTATSTNPHGIATHNKTYSTAGSFSASGEIELPGDCAAVIRYSTDARSVRNHPVYLFNYYHNVFRDAANPVDQILAAQVTAYNEYGDDWLAGYNDGTQVRIRCGPRGAVAQARTTLQFVRHRDFPT